MSSLSITIATRLKKAKKLAMSADNNVTKWVVLAEFAMCVHGMFDSKKMDGRTSREAIQSEHKFFCGFAFFLSEDLIVSEKCYAPQNFLRTKYL